MEKLKKNTIVTTNIEFKHSIGQRGRYTGKVLQSVQDCKDEIKALLDSEHFVSQMLYMVSTFKQFQS